MEKTWAPTVAGILNIVAGIMSLIGGVVLAILGSVAHHAIYRYCSCDDVYMPCSPAVFFSGLALMLLIFVLLSAPSPLSSASSLWVSRPSYSPSWQKKNSQG